MFLVSIKLDEFSKKVYSMFVIVSSKLKKEVSFSIT